MGVDRERIYGAMVGLRNRVVHGYQEMNYEPLRFNLTDFLAEVGKLAEG